VANVPQALLTPADIIAINVNLGTSGKFTAGVNKTGGQFSTGVIDTGSGP
jgi:hypothetical protein